MVKTCVQGLKELDHPPKLSQAHYQGSELGVEQLGHKIVPIWDVNTTGRALTCLTSVPVPCLVKVEKCISGWTSEKICASSEVALYFLATLMTLISNLPKPLKSQPLLCAQSNSPVEEPINQNWPQS